MRKEKMKASLLVSMMMLSEAYGMRPSVSKVDRSTFIAGSIAALVPGAAVASVAEPTASSVARTVDREVARKILQIERLNVDSNLNGAKAKHIPRIKVNGDKLDCYVSHTNDAERKDFIEYVWLKDEETEVVFAASKFSPTDTPALRDVAYKKGSTVTPYAYCNMHGLWIGDSEDL